MQAMPRLRLFSGIIEATIAAGIMLMPGVGFSLMPGDCITDSGRPLAASLYRSHRVGNAHGGRSGYPRKSSSVP